MSEKLPLEPEGPDHWTLLRDAAVMQFKLVVDGLRDLILVPASLVAAAISLIKSENGRPGPHFYRLLGLGKQSERYINLFGAYRHSPERFEQDDAVGAGSIDDIVNRVESFVVEEYRRGGVTAQAKARIDQALSAMQRRSAADAKEDGDSS